MGGYLMETIKILEIIKSAGVDFKVMGNNLKGRNLKVLGNDTRRWISDHKAEIIQLLTSKAVEEKQRYPPKKLYCFVCGSAKWWRKKDGSGPWVCTVCHPPAINRNNTEYSTWQTISVERTRSHLQKT